MLIGISLYLFFEAYNRFINPAEIKGGIMIIVAAIGLTANVTGTLLLKSGAKDNMNIPFFLPPSFQRLCFKLWSYHRRNFFLLLQSLLD